MKPHRVVRLVALMAMLYGLVALAMSCERRAKQTAATSSTDSAIGAAALSAGQSAFLANCAMCHGTWGAGDGPLAAQLEQGAKVRPANLTDGARLRSIGRNEVIRVIELGGSHTARSNLMPPWQGRLDHRLIEQIADFVMTLPDLSSKPSPVMTEAFLAAPAGSAPEGRRLFVFYCSMCHGPEGHGDGRLADTLWARNGIRPRNLTDSTYFASRTDEELDATVALGGGHVHKSIYMPAWSVTLTTKQIKDLVSYVRAISRTQSH